MQRLPHRACLGALLGTLIGDTLGLPYESMSRPRVQAFLRSKPLKQSFLLGRGMISDDTEHHCMVANALLAHPQDLDAFRRSLAWRLRFWLLGLPAGIGGATMRALVRLWLGVSPERSGVDSAGNGTAMRSALIGLMPGPEDHWRRYLKAATQITHSHPLAVEGSLIVALTARLGAQHGPNLSFEQVREQALKECQEPFWEQAFKDISEFLKSPEQSLEQLADHWGLEGGVTGYIAHSLPIALAAVFRWPGEGLMVIDEVVRLGGDTDTVAAIAGALVGAINGPEVWPEECFQDIWDWPRSVAYCRALGEQFEDFARAPEVQSQTPVALFWPALALRNAVFLSVVLLHALRRLLPPYR